MWKGALYIENKEQEQEKGQITLKRNLKNNHNYTVKGIYNTMKGNNYAKKAVTWLKYLKN